MGDLTMTNAPFMQLYVADYLADTQHLTTEQNGAYMLLLMTMWRNAGSLPNDEKKLARIARVTLKRWHIIADDVMEFFDIQGDIVTQKRLVEEFQKAVSKSEKRKTSGSLGGKAKSLKNNNVHLANASELPKHSSEPEPYILKKDTNVSQKKGCRLPEDFQPDFSIAYSEGFTEPQAQKLFDNFKDYWTAKAGKDATKLDWQATWRNWVRSSHNQKFKTTTTSRFHRPTPINAVSSILSRFENDEQSRTSTSSQIDRDHVELLPSRAVG